MDAQVIYDVFHLNYWDWRIACLMFFGGMGVGSYLFSVFVGWYYQEKYPHISKIGAIIEPICIFLALGFLMSDLGHPARAYKLFTSFHPTSPLWWGGWFQTIFLIVTCWHAYLWVRGEPGQATLRKRVGWVGVPLALIVGGYYGFLMTVVKAHPLWNAGPSTVTAILSFAICGIAAVVLALVLLPDSSRLLSDIRLTRDIMGVGLVAQLFTITLWAIALANGPRTSAQSLHELNQHYGFAFWGIAVGVGLVAPLVIGVCAIVRERQEHTSSINIRIPVLTSGMVLVGAFVFRYVILLAGQTF
jgi:formate-dependent nitrite reductase membrane component NrfD